jgi:hypothetical protein
VVGHPRRRGSGSPIALAPQALSLPSILIGFDGSRFAARALDTCVEIAEKKVCPLFSKPRIGRPGPRDGFARAFPEQSR